MLMDWTTYQDLLDIQGNTRRDRVICQTKRILRNRLINSPSYKNVLIDGVEQNVVITSSTEMYHKKINALPDEHIYTGSIVEWNKRHFIITNTDTEDEVYQRGEMYECNVYLRWQNEKGEIVARYGYSEDISKFAAGVVNAALQMGIQQTYTIQFPLDEETIKIRRDKRFLIDITHDKPSAYVVTNRNVTNGNDSVTPAIYDDPEFDFKDKLLYLTLSQTQLGDKDNTELMIADYFVPDAPITANSCEIVGKPTVKVGGSSRRFEAKFYGSDGEEIALTPVWTLVNTAENEGKFTLTVEDGYAYVSVVNKLNMLGEQCELILRDSGNTCEDTVFVKAVSMYG